MADNVDVAQQREAENLVRCLASTIQLPIVVSASYCEECDAPIPEARRKALPGVMICVHCKTIEELKLLTSVSSSDYPVRPPVE